MNCHVSYLNLHLFSAVFFFKFYFIQVCWYKRNDNTLLYSFLEFSDNQSKKGIWKCAKAAICIISFIHLALKLIPCLWSTFNDFQNEAFVQTLISQPNISQINNFMDQNLSWLIINQKQYQFWKQKILFSCYALLNIEPFFDSCGR